jgi:release factor glutamine methyltransferase
MRLIEMYQDMGRHLAAVQQPQAMQLARWLLCDLLTIDSATVFWQQLSSRLLTQVEQDRVLAAVDQLLAGVPLGRVLGWREFWGLPFRLSPATLDPRADSETLVDAVLRAYPDRTQPLSLLDLGTGSGCLLLSLLHEYPNAWGLGVDLAEAALHTARGNAEVLGLESRACWLNASWVSAIGMDEGGQGFDLIVSNPPYLAFQESAGVDRAVVDHDPPLALWGGADGLADYRQLLASSTNIGQLGTDLWLEIGAGQVQAVTDLATASGWLAAGQYQDLAGIVRVLRFRR